VFLFSLLLFSCKKDSNKEDIVGTWTYDNATFSTMIGSKTFQQYMIDELGLTAAEAQAYETLFNEQMKQSFTGSIVVKSDNTYSSTMGGESDTGTWSLSSDKSTLTIDSDKDVPVTVDVIELTGSKLHLQQVQTTQEDINQDTIPETITVTVDLYFKK
jgi:hypothetical protein